MAVTLVCALWHTTNCMRCVPGMFFSSQLFQLFTNYFETKYRYTSARLESSSRRPRFGFTMMYPCVKWYYRPPLKVTLTNGDFELSDAAMVSAESRHRKMAPNNINLPILEPTKITVQSPIQADCRIEALNDLFSGDKTFKSRILMSEGMKLHKDRHQNNM